MALLVCQGCTAAYSVGAPRCPQCGSTDHTEQGEQSMPKITRHGGPTVAGAQVVAGAWGDTDNWPAAVAEATSGEHGPETVGKPTEGSEGVSAGSSSETSPKKPSPSPKMSAPAHPKPARTTGNRSAKGRTDSSSAGGTAGARTDRSSDGDAS